MDQQSNYMKEIEDKYAALNIDAEEEDGVEYEEELKEINNIDTRWSLVGHFFGGYSDGFQYEAGYDDGDIET